MPDAWVERCISFPVFGMIFTSTTGQDSDGAQQSSGLFASSEFSGIDRPGKKGNQREAVIAFLADRLVRMEGRSRFNVLRGEEY